FLLLNDTSTPQFYTLSLHDALPIYHTGSEVEVSGPELGEFAPAHAALDVGLHEQLHRLGADGLVEPVELLGSDDGPLLLGDRRGDRKSTRLNSSHVKNSYAVFCLKK